MANFKGFAQGLNSGSAVVARGLAAGEARKRTGLAKEQLDMTKLDTQRDLTQQAIDSLANNIAAQTKEINERREADRLPPMSTEEFTKVFERQIQLGIVNSNLNTKAQGQYTPDRWRSTLQMIMRQPTERMLAERKARAEATGEVAGASTVAPYVGEDAARMRIGGVKDSLAQKVDEAQLAISKRNADINAMNAQTSRMNASAAEYLEVTLPTGENVYVDIKSREGQNFMSKLPPGSTANKVGSKSTGRSMRVNPDGSVEIVEGGASLPVSKQYGSADQRAAAGSGVEKYDEAISLLSDVADDIEKDPTKYGFVGNVRGAVESATGILSDAVEALGGGSIVDVAENALAEISEKLSPKQKTEWESVAALNPVENALAVMLAKSRNPQGRLIVSELDKARDDVQLQGMKGTGQVKQKTVQLLRELEGGREREANRLNELKGSFGSSGKASKGSKSTEKPIEEMTDAELQAELERLRSAK